MGFDASTATRALQATNGDVDRAAELLLAQGSGSTSHQPIDLVGVARDNGDDDDEVMRRVLQLSVEDEHRRQRSAASRRAGEAALARAAARNTATTKKAVAAKQSIPAASKQMPPPALIRPTMNATVGLATHHPDVKVIPKLQDKSKEEQVLRCADRLKASPQAVDTLIRALTTIQNNPNDDKFRTVDKTTSGFQKSLADVPGAEDLLLAMSFRRHGNNKLVLERSMVDPALLYLGISALEQTKLTDEYMEGKRKLAFNGELSQILAGADSSESEAIKRSGFLSKCPSEPVNGRGALMQVKMAEQTTLRRRFDADDTLADVLNWLGAHGSAIPDRILSREWSLVDLNHYPVSPLDTANTHLTLQYLGCWPSGKLELVPSTEEWMQGAKTARRTSRGLGSAPSDAL